MSAPAEQFDPTTGEILDADAPDNSGWDKARHCITDLRGADWAGRKLREAQEQVAANLAMHHAEVDELRLKIIAAEERLSKANAPFHRTSTYMENALRAFASTPEGKAEVLKGLRSKSRLLPSGVRIGWRERKTGEYRWDQSRTPAENKAALLAWAQSEMATRGPDRLVDHVPTPHLENIKAYLATLDAGNPGDTRAPPGLEYVSPGETLTITTKGEES